MARAAAVVTRDHIGTVRLVDRKTRVVEVLGPRPLGSRRGTDQKLLYQRYGPTPPFSVGHCFLADGRQARFLVNEGQWGDALLDLLASRPRTPARPAKPYGTRGWLVEG
jgi:hypothetical protein